MYLNGISTYYLSPSSSIDNQWIEKPNAEASEYEKTEI